MLFNLNLSRLPFLGQEADLDLLLCTGFNSEHAVLFLTLAELHVSVLTGFIKLIKLLQNLMKLIPNHVMV